MNWRAPTLELDRDESDVPMMMAMIVNLYTKNAIYIRIYCHVCPSTTRPHSFRVYHSFVGYKKIVVSSKPTASSFSFGQKHKHIARNDTDGPGPANYDVTGLSVRGIYFAVDWLRNVWSFF